jgi:hypothetical protein
VPQVEQDDPRITAPPVEPTVTAPVAPLPLPEEPDVDPLVLELEPLLLLAEDVPWATLAPPEPWSATANRYGASDCPMLDTVRGVELFDRVEILGAVGTVDFDYAVFDTDSAATAGEILGAAAMVGQTCPEFVDGRGPGRLAPLMVPTGGAWQTAGVVIDAFEQPVMHGFWVFDDLVVRVRVYGPAGEPEFASHAQAVTDKLNTAGAAPQVGGDTTELDEDGMPRTLWSRTLDVYELGATWTRLESTLLDAKPPGTTGQCGVSFPAQGDSLWVWYERDDGVMVSYGVTQGSAGFAAAWIDFYEAIAACQVLDSRYDEMSYVLVPTSPDQVIGADELVVVQSSLRGYDGFEGLITGVVRQGGLVVTVLMWYDVAMFGPPPEAQPVDEVLRLLHASLD